MPRSSSARKLLLRQFVALLLHRLARARFTLRLRSRFAQLRRWEHKAVHSPDSVRRVACRFVDSRFSSAVPQWDSRNPDNDRRFLRVRVVRCTLRGKLPVAVPWEWALPVWFRRPRQVRGLLVVPEPRLGVLASVMFHVA